MRGLAPAVLLGLVLCFGSLGCQPLVEGPQAGEIPVAQGLPKEYGDLVAVTAGGGGWNLWFQRADQTIVRVWLGLNYALGESVLEIPRR